MTTIILQGSNLNRDKANAIVQRTGGSLAKRTHHYRISGANNISAERLATLRKMADFDINRLPDSFDPTQVKLLITDMDSTFISIECIDEIADFANLKPQVAAITESAMRGEIGFEASLTKRVALLTNLDNSALQKVYDERLKLNPGADLMLATLRAKGIKIALVSGGFTFFTSRLKARCQLDYAHANVLEENDGKLTGKVIGNIVGAEAKETFLRKICAELGIGLNQAIAMGDGANDLKMMKPAGLSIAYHARPTVQAQANIAFNYCGLDGILGMLDCE
ncbi:MAG: phosphoserine phosphatase SerB [Gammaproteobacteria bacterium]|nr:phosphoserine phosphatase SerB [Gammaproteobacteria bacterium]